MVAMLERERRSLTSSLIALALFAAAFAFYGNMLLMYALLSLRVASFLVTRRAAANLLHAVREKDDTKWQQRIMVLSMCITGVTLGLLLLPPPPGTPFAASLMVRAVALVAVTLIPVTLAAMPHPRDAMLASFFLTVCALALYQPETADPAIGVVAALTVIGIRVYSANTGHHIVAAAAVLVENRQLSKDLSHALERAEYFGSRDPLTGLYNRRKLFEQRAEDGGDGGRQLLMIDLDHFKAINDRFGHSAGDRVLVAAADAIRKRLSAVGNGDHLAFRLGGEEFLVILDGMDSAEAAMIAEELREDIARIGPEDAGLNGMETTASVGFARWHRGEELDDVLQRSDAACYAAKRAGRNRVRAAA